MPELPEVETIKQGISPFLEGQVIHSVQVRQTKLRLPISPELTKEAPGQSIIKVRRRAKYFRTYEKLIKTEGLRNSFMR